MVHFRCGAMYTVYDSTPQARLCLPLAGGALYAFQSYINIDGDTYISHNTGYDGGENALQRAH